MQRSCEKMLHCATYILIVISIICMGTVEAVGTNRTRRMTLKHCYTVENFKTCKKECALKSCLKCCEVHQSPIDIRYASRCSFPHPLVFINYDTDQQFMINNTGKTAYVTLKHPENTARRPMVTGGPVSGVWYLFEELHFHWGANSTAGSDHTIMGESFPLEMHIVHVNVNYRTVEEAQKHVDGLLIFSVLFRISDVNNVKYEPLVKALRRIKCEDSSTEIFPPFPMHFLLPTNTVDYVTYFGSTTTYPYKEAATWIVFESFRFIAESQLNKFRSLRREDKCAFYQLPGKCQKCRTQKCRVPLVNNFRETQALNGRTIQES